jgi:hypothetical protein
MALASKPVEDPNMAIVPVRYFDALKDELKRQQKGGDPARIKEIEAELKKAGPAAVKDLRAALSQLEARGDTRARGVRAELERVEGELGRRPTVERAADTTGGDAGASRAAS